jgi:hypothetical protein
LCGSIEIASLVVVIIMVLLFIARGESVEVKGLPGSGKISSDVLARSHGQMSAVA